jgi:chemotaxis protein histidine kinase CheA/ActR/RegA family two-component response regulator
MSNTNKNSALVKRLNSVREKLAADSIDQQALVDVAAALSQFSKEAKKASLRTVQEGAELLAMVTELASNAGNHDQHENLLAYIQDSVMVLDDAVMGQDNDDDIEAFIQFGHDNFTGLLAMPAGDEADSNAWESASDELPADETPAEPSGKEIAMMLAALSGQEDSSGSESEDETTEPVENEFIDKPTAGSDEAAKRDLAADPEMLEAYLDDALRCVASMEASAMAGEQNPSDREPVRQFCRELHTLKGASATVGLSGMASYLHDLESSLETMFGNDDAETDADQLFAAVDQVRTQIESLQPQMIAVDENQTDQSAGNPNPVANKPSTDFSNFASNDDASIRIRASKLDRLMDMLAELVVLRNRQECEGVDFNELNEELSRCAARVSFANEQQRLDHDAVVANLADDADDIDVFGDGLTAGLSEVAKDISAVSQGLRDLQKPVAENNKSISRFIRDFRQELMQLRRVPVSGLFSRLQRATRDAAKSENKSVRVELIGENAGLEQEIQERLFDSLLHVVRNSVSHGVETSEQRVKAGKDRIGTVTLEATSNAQLLIIEVRDDGGGIDYEAVRNRATDKGIISPGQELTNEQLGKLIFHAGFSTKETASAVSGRGVGMEIVANTVEQLKGRIEVSSVKGQGTTIRLLIPLKSGIEHVMVFRAGGQLFALPMQAVSAAKRDVENSNALMFTAALGLTSADDSNQQARDVLKLRRTGANRSGEGSTLSVRVDELIGPEEVVVRKLPNLLRQHPLLSGITLSGSGKKVLLLDTEQVIQFCDQTDSTDSRATEINDSTETVASSDQKQALVVDDSLTARRALSKLLRKHGFAVTEAGDGVKAIEHLQRKQFDLLVTDLDMPRMGGLELLTDMQGGSYSDAFRVVVSSRDEQKFRDQAADVGAQQYISKPVSESSVVQMLEKFELLQNPIEEPVA